MRCPPTLIPRNRATYLIVSRLVIGPSSLVVGRWSLVVGATVRFLVFGLPFPNLSTTNHPPNSAPPRPNCSLARLLACSTPLYSALRSVYRPLACRSQGVTACL